MPITLTEGWLYLILYIKFHFHRESRIGISLLSVLYFMALIIPYNTIVFLLHLLFCSFTKKPQSRFYISIHQYINAWTFRIINNLMKNIHDIIHILCTSKMSQFDSYTGTISIITLSGVFYTRVETISFPKRTL